MSIYSIYKSTNKINGKVYIGFDSNWPNRIGEHKVQHRNKNYHFYYAIRKYGWDNFEWELLYQSYDGEHCLKYMESYFIEQYDSFNSGYNSTLGGEGTLGWAKFITEDTRKKMSDGQKGKVIPNKVRIKISKTMKGIPKSQETKAKMSASQKGKPKSEEHRQKIHELNTKLYMCPHCNREFNYSKLKQWHLAKCKHIMKEN
jgi:group I intron endonuclease